MTISLYMRAVSLEYARQRRTADYFTKSSELSKINNHHETHTELAKLWNERSIAFKAIYVDILFYNLFRKSSIQLNNYTILFPFNCEISCCGCFMLDRDDIRSIISYNLISFKDSTLFIIAAPHNIAHSVERYISKYINNDRSDIELMLNDIAFNRCEEPLIAPSIWNSLSKEDRRSIRISLNHPDFSAEYYQIPN
jgi:hypothetical protein